MKVIYNNIIPFGRFRAINLCGVVFAKQKYGKLNKTIINHESVHTIQQLEMLIVFFYLWYVIEWLVRFCMCGDAIKAYYNISFEREAYHNERNYAYRRYRRLWAWTSYLVRK
ncbi:MAG: hypothetical protein MJZ74_00480 [Muribaculaceae bacterium]|nr:hypothetical protein [Muribaculaceae bacterium]